MKRNTHSAPYLQNFQRLRFGTIDLLTILLKKGMRSVRNKNLPVQSITGGRTSLMCIL
jgi:hypothetical protein